MCPSALLLLTSLGGTVGRFGDHPCVDCTNLPCTNGRNPFLFLDIKFTRPKIQNSKATNLLRNPPLMRHHHQLSFPRPNLKGVPRAVGLVEPRRKSYGDTISNAAVKKCMHDPSASAHVKRAARVASCMDGDALFFTTEALIRQKA